MTLFEAEFKDFSLTVSDKLYKACKDILKKHIFPTI